jgi:hypothetical protein
VITTVQDLQRFDKALRDYVLLTRDNLTTAWTQTPGPSGPLPTGLGWFVQNYNGEPLVWQFDSRKTRRRDGELRPATSPSSCWRTATASLLRRPGGRRCYRVAVRLVPALLRP